MFYLIIICTTILLIIKSKKNLHMLQQNLYNENNRYIKWNLKNINQFINLEIINIVIAIIGFLVVYDLRLYNFICQIVICLIYFVAIYISYSNQKKEQVKKPLIYTKRIKRLIFTIMILYLIPIIILLVYKLSTRYYWLLVLIYIVATYLNALVIYIANIINKPIEKLVYLYYRKKALTKLKNMNDLKVVGITGSYGKTSCKNILGDILNIKYNALPTPKNLNTNYGLMMTINNKMDKFTEIFIAEMGAYVRGEIKQLCDLVKPQYGILTRIGTAHLESFGSEDNIIKAKFELIEALPDNGLAVLNMDDYKQVNYTLKNNCRKIWIGIDNAEADLRAQSIKCSDKGTSFKLQLKNDKKTYKFETKLLGKHNVYNILSAIALGLEFGVDIGDLQTAVQSIRPIEHRLELKKLGSFYMIDDAYNSNPVGAQNAIEVLQMMPGIKIVVTPGMIELGEREYECNEKFGEQIAGVSDYVVLIGEEKTKPIRQGLKKSNFNFDNVVIYNDVREAYKFINSIKSSNDKEVYALFENDLPDTYNEK